MPPRTTSTNKQITTSAISYSGSELQNEIPRSIRDAEYLCTFKKRFQEFLASLDRDFFYSGFLFSPFYSRYLVGFR